MRALLSLTLSVAIIFGSVAPSYAQFVSQGGKGAINALKNTAKEGMTTGSTSFGIVRNIAGGVARGGVTVTRAASESQVPYELSSVDLGTKLQQEVYSARIKAESGLEAPTAAEIDAYLVGEISNTVNSFKEIPVADINTLISAQDPAFIKSLEALERGAAYAQMGAQPEVLTDFYKQAKGSVLEEVSLTITARGLLRMKAYVQLRALYAKTSSFGVWKGIQRYATESNIPLVLGVPQGEVAVNEGLREFLGKRGNGAVLHTDASYEATKIWMEGFKPEGVPARSAQGKAPEAVAETPVVAKANTEPVGIPVVDVTATAPLTVAPLNAGLGSGVKEPVSAEVKAVAAPTGASAVAAKASSTSGVLYGGVPFFAMADFVKRGYKAFRGWFAKKQPQAPVVEEGPGLHDNGVYPVYDAPKRSLAAEETDDLVGAADASQVISVADGGFKMSMETAQGDKIVENLLPNVDITVDGALKGAGYNRLALTDKYIFQFRNQVQDPVQLKQFFIELSNKESLLTLLKGAETLHMPRPLRIKLERTPNERHEVVSLLVYRAENLAQNYVTADVEASLLPSNEGRLILEKDGQIYFESEAGKRTLIKDYYIRLPKEDSKYWATIMQSNPQTPFSLKLHATMDKTALISKSIPLLQIGLGKTTAPELSTRTTLDESTSSAIMMGINNVLPALAGLVHPMLKRYGEAAVARFGAWMFAAAGATALAGGLYGALGDGKMTSWQLAAFITSSVFISLGTNITRYVQNILIKANRGEIVPQDAFKKKGKAGKSAVTNPEKVYTPSYLANRVKEVFTVKPSSTKRDGVLFQTATMFKNLGTMIFLGLPWLLNIVSEKAFGYNLGLDFSASYVPYSLFAMWTAFRLQKVAYKNAFPMDMTSVSNNFKETLARVNENITSLPAEALLAKEGEISVDLLNAAKQLKGSIDALVPVEVRAMKTSADGRVALHEQEAVASLKDALAQSGKLTPEQVETVGNTLQQAFDKLGHRDVKLMDVLRTPKLKTALAAMMMATVHELSISNGFSFAVREALAPGNAQAVADAVAQAAADPAAQAALEAAARAAESTEANALVAFTLYGSMFAGRVLGNVINRRISGGSMYALSSLASLAGTGMMVAANAQNIPLLLAGAVVASFGVGNFFSQMYEYMVGLNEKYCREIALLITYTMPAAAVLSSPMRSLVNYTGWQSADLFLAGLFAAGSLVFTRSMFANSSVVQVGKYQGKKLWRNVKKIFGFGKQNPNNQPPAAGLDDAAPAQ